MFSTYIALLGIWTILVPFFGSTRAFYTWNNFIAGIVLSITGFILSNRQLFTGFAAAMTGFWLIVSAYIPPLQLGIGVYWNNIITGIVITIIGITSLLIPLLRWTPHEYFRKRLKPM
jgi:hypothetical protein